VTRVFPREELYSLVDQMKRAAISIPSNIAEGNSRNTLKEQYQFFSIARGSCSELETQTIIAHDLWYIREPASLLAEIEEIWKMLSGLMKSKIPDIQNNISRIWNL
jgi:four helix bundle protein